MRASIYVRKCIDHVCLLMWYLFNRRHRASTLWFKLWWGNRIKTLLKHTLKLQAGNSRDERLKTRKTKARENNSAKLGNGETRYTLPRGSPCESDSKANKLSKRKCQRRRHKGGGHTRYRTAPAPARAGDNRHTPPNVSRKRRRRTWYRTAPAPTRT